MDKWGAVEEAEGALKRYSGAITISRDVVAALVEAIKEEAASVLEPFSIGGLRQVVIEHEHALGDATDITRVSLDEPTSEDVARFAALFEQDRR